ncbi:PAS domain S-box protein [bacterium]|nr:PAS domain S-box protein [bacterium]
MEKDFKIKGQLADELAQLQKKIKEQEEIIIFCRQKEETLQNIQINLEYIIRELTTDLTEAKNKLMQEIAERRHTEKALRESEERLRAQYNGMPIPTYTWQFIDGDFELVDYNDAGLANSDGKIACLLRTKASKIYSDSPEILEDMRRCFNERTTICKEMFYHFKSVDKEGYFATTYAYVPPDLVLVHDEDITERKRFEKELQESEERFRQIAELSPFPIAILDSGGRYIYINNKFIDVFGYTLDEVHKGSDWFKLVFPDPRYRRQAMYIWKSDIAKIDKAANKTPVDLRFTKGDENTHKGFSGENSQERFSKARMDEIAPKPRVFKIRCKDGSFRDIIFRPVKMKDDKLFILYEDITERKRAEKALLKSEQQLSGIIASITDHMSIIDERHKIVWANDVTKTSFGNDIIGKNCHAVFRRRDKVCDPCPVSQTFSDGQIHENEIDVISADGKKMVFWCDSNVATRYEDGRPRMVVEISRDITERKHAEEMKAKLERQLQQSQKMEALGTLAGGVAHDFNNILSFILGYTELTLHDLPEGSSVQYKMKEILRACNRAKDIIKQILIFTHQIEHERKPVQFHSIVREALKLIKVSGPANIKIHQDIDPKSGVVIADPTQIHQLVVNLCSNACYAMRKTGGTLTVKLGRIEAGNDSEKEHQNLKAGRYAKLTISDTGHGIKPNNLERIFDPFFTTKATGKGTGLGLSMVHGIVKSHNGEITVKSEPEKGTTFDVYLPISTQRAAAEKSKSEAPPKGKEHILFVDDEKHLVFIAEEAFERLGYRVTALTDSVKALEIFRQRPSEFDIVVTDQTLPNMTGDKLAAELMLIRPDIPIIISTGYSDLITKESSKKMGIRELIMKPILIHDLALTIRRILDEETGSSQVNDAGMCQ